MAYVQLLGSEFIDTLGIYVDMNFYYSILKPIKTDRSLLLLTVDLKSRQPLKNVPLFPVFPLAAFEILPRVTIATNYSQTCVQQPPTGPQKSGRF